MSDDLEKRAKEVAGELRDAARRMDVPCPLGPRGLENLADKLDPPRLPHETGSMLCLVAHHDDLGPCQMCRHCTHWVRPNRLQEPCPARQRKEPPAPASDYDCGGCGIPASVHINGDCWGDGVCKDCKGTQYSKAHLKCIARRLQ